ncbi:MAG: putative maltokinase, partial [Ideonella sp.]
PVLYYGDEIGMGDNIFLGDRDGVRTPMQWTPDRNGGFSRADPQRLYLPPIQDPIYGFEAVNVEAQSREASSLLSWTRRLLTVRSGSKAFGRGHFTMLHPGNRKVLAYVREHGDDVILCVSNISRTAQPVELELGAWKGRVPVEMMGRNPFPPIGELPYLMTLPGYGFFWFRLSLEVAPPSWHTDRLPIEDLPVLVLFDDWNSFFRGKVVPWRIGMAEKTRNQLESDLLPRFMLRQRWYATKNETPTRARLVDQGRLGKGRSEWLLSLVDVDVDSAAGGSARYFVPMSLAYDDDDEERTRALAPVAVAKVRQLAKMGVLADAMADEAFCRTLVEAIGQQHETKADKGRFLFRRGASFAALVGDALAEPTLPLHRLTNSSNSVSLLGDKLFLKAYRRMQPGVGLELEMGRFLTDVVNFKHCVPVAGSVQYVDADGSLWTLALLQAQVANQGDAWQFAVEQLKRLLEASAEADGGSREGIEPMVDRAQVLASRIAELHIALARRTGDAGFDPEPVQAEDLQRWGTAIRAEALATLKLLENAQAGWPAASAALAKRILAAREALLERIDALATSAPVGLLTRLHGDLHLGQVLITRDDFLLIDFEGEPTRSLEERRAKQSALRDVAGMLRSFDYARHTALQQAAKSPAELDRLAPLARDWEGRIREGFLQTYRDLAVAGGLYADAEQFRAAGAMLDLFELEKALYELRYEIDNRPDWIEVPLAGIATLLGVTS